MPDPAPTVLATRCMVVCPRDSDDPVNWFGFVCVVPFESKAERDAWIRHHYEATACSFDILIDGDWLMGDQLRHFLREIVRDRRQRQEWERQKRNWERTGRYT
jgi:hypothetical protein